ncbi:MAG: ATP-binding cassette domain-containing protein [Acidobacteria bacterium]|nr:ATP-binding cassette domain-containing protein [Acidobacteriota bacterium]
MISVENLSKYYGHLCAVDQINFSVERGEIVGLLGPNGAGKTTTLRMLTGYMKPTSGDIHIMNLDIHQDALQIKKLMGYLPESAPLYREMLVLDYLDYVASIREISPDEKLARIRHLANVCGLNEVMHRPIGELSKGYKQRVGLAHAMMNDPEILVLDEPTSGLDPNQIVEIRGIIKQIGKEKTIILSTHILSEVEATCDRVIIINRGKIVADENTASLQHSTQKGYTVRLSLKGAEFEAVQADLTTLPDVAQVAPAGQEEGRLSVDILCNTADDIRGQIYARVKRQDWILLEFYQQTRTLESIFRELTKEN